MKNDQFELLWRLIDQAKASAELLKVLLNSLSKKELIAFHNEFRRAVQNLWIAADDGDWYERYGPQQDMSDDTQQDILTFVVSQGAKYYADILAHPERLRWDIDPDEVPYLGLSSQVFWERFQEEIYPNEH